VRDIHSTQAHPRSNEYDVAVLGGGMAGGLPGTVPDLMPPSSPKNVQKHVTRNCGQKQDRATSGVGPVHRRLPGQPPLSGGRVL
jgi:hypothetical protein